jgi:hypothetical protein
VTTDVGAGARIDEPPLYKEEFARFPLLPVRAEVRCSNPVNARSQQRACLELAGFAREGNPNGPVPPVESCLPRIDQASARENIAWPIDQKQY